MASSRTSSASGGPYPFIGLSVVVLVFNAILVATIPPNPYRSAATIAAVFATGYCALALIVGRSFRLSSAEILAYTVGLAILITSLSAVAVSITGIPITDFAITVVGLPISVAAWFLRGSRGRSWETFTGGMRRVLDFSDYSRIEKLAAGGLLAGISVALVALLLLSTVLYPDRLSPGLAVVGPDGTPGSLPTTFAHGIPQSLEVSVLGGTDGGTFSVRIRLIPQNATGNESFHPVAPASPLTLDAFAESVMSVAVAPGGTWTQDLSVSVAGAGRFYLRLDLIDSTSSIVASNVLPVVVT